MQEIITIEKIVANGLGLGRLADGMVVMTPHVLPGEKIRFSPVRRRKNYLEARLAEVVEPSARRIDPVCSHYTLCGGCDLQHTDINNQLALKQTILAELLVRAGLSEENDGNQFLQPPLASPDEFGYRLRIRLQVGDDGRMGFFRYRSHVVEGISSCPLARSEINEVFNVLRNDISMNRLLKQTDALEFILSPDDGKVILLLHFKRKPRANDKKLAISVQRNVKQLESVFLDAGAHGFFGPFFDEDSGRGEHEQLVRLTLPVGVSGKDPITLTLEPGGFCQVNQGQNENFIRLLLAWAEIKSTDRALDLFCGMGNFSLPAALFASEITGFDLQRSAIRSAKRNALLAGFDNCVFEKGSALEGARKLVRDGRDFDLIILDPPRAGCAEVLPYLPELGAGRIIYISCDPATLSRDLTGLVRSGYRIDKMRFADMFPQTHHLETMTLLTRK